MFTTNKHMMLMYKSFEYYLIMIRLVYVKLWDLYSIMHVLYNMYMAYVNILEIYLNFVNTLIINSICGIYMFIRVKGTVNLHVDFVNKTRNLMLISFEFDP